GDAQGGAGGGPRLQGGRPPPLAGLRLQALRGEGQFQAHVHKVQRPVGRVVSRVPAAARGRRARGGLRAGRAGPREEAQRQGGGYREGTSFHGGLLSARGWDWSCCKPEDGPRHHTKIVRKVGWRSPCREIAEPARRVGVTSGARPFTWPGAGEPAEELAPPAGPGLSRVAGITRPAQEGLSRDISDFGARSCPVAGNSSP